MAKCVNALTRATLISTARTEEVWLIAAVCQCPHTGNTHFYWDSRLSSTAPKIVSMPSHGQHSFLRINHRNFQKTEIVSMPSHGQHSFLRYKRRES